MASEGPPYRCELYFRTDTIGQFDVQRRVLDRIRSLEADGFLERADVEATWQGIETREHAHGSAMRETYEEFATWASVNGFSLAPAFDVRSRYVPGTTERRECVIFPVVALAIYQGQQLRAVVPCSDEFGHYTVHEALEGFERGDVDRWVSRFDGVSVERTAPKVEAAASL